MNWLRVNCFGGGEDGDEKEFGAEVELHLKTLKNTFPRLKKLSNCCCCCCSTVPYCSLEKSNH